MRYFTSDLHLGSALINKYAHRPFASAEDAMFSHVIAINNACKPSDMLIHVGDFMLDGADRHGEVEDIGLKFSQEDYLARISTRVVLLSGNHDDGHNAEADCKSMVLDLNQNWRNVYVGHFPSYHQDYHGLVGYGKKVQINLCGHVHDKWLLKYDADKHVLNINVGVDVWDYKPVSDVQITKMLDYLWNGKVRAPDVMTRKQYEEWVEKNEKQVKLERAIRKQDRYIKKGLTPEICQQRKEKALRKKGLLK